MLFEQLESRRLLAGSEIELVAALDLTTIAGSTEYQSSQRGVRFGDDMLTVDPARSYLLEGEARSGLENGAQYNPANRQYFGFASYDVDHNLILPFHVTKYPDAVDTTLAADLHVGDSKLYLTDAAGWSNAGSAATRSFAWYGYRTSDGVTHPDYTYTRNVLENAWDPGGILTDAQGTFIQLKSPWNGPSLLAGAAVRNAASIHGSFNYNVLTGTIPDEWTRYSGVISGTGDRYSQFRPGTAFIRPVLVNNYHTGDVNHVQWRSISLTYADNLPYSGKDVIDLGASVTSPDEPSTFEWAHLSGPVVSIQNPNSRVTSVALPRSFDDGQSTLQLTAAINNRFIVETIAIPFSAVAVSPIAVALDLTTIAGSFEYQSSQKGVRFGDDMLTVDPARSYLLEGEARSGLDNGTQYNPANRQYFGFASYDADRNLILPFHVTKFPDAVDTTLAADLHVGDNKLYLTDATGWSTAGATATRSLAWYGYRTSDGVTHPDYTYTRNVLENAWDPGGILTDTQGTFIQLKSPWNGPPLLAGAAVRNAASIHGSYNYNVLTGAISNEWKSYSGVIRGTGNRYDQFRPGTAFIKPVLVINYHDGDANEVRWRDISLTYADNLPYSGGDTIDLSAKVAATANPLSVRWVQESGPDLELPESATSRLTVTLPQSIDGGDIAIRFIAAIENQLDLQTVRIPVWDIKNQLWSRVISPYLQGDSATDRDAYDAGHYLMVPLHASFSFNNQVWIEEFAEHIERFMLTGANGLTYQLHRLQYLYLGSQFLSLAAGAGYSHLIPEGLPGLLYDELETVWEIEPAWQWDREPFPGGMRERLAWKRALVDPAYSYYPAVTDHELFTFAIAADLRAYDLKTSHLGTAQRDLVNEVLQVARSLFSERIVHQADGGWLFQPGYWTDHPAYQHAGQSQLAPDLPPSPIEGIAEDTSHSLRWPLWITSFISAYGSETPEFQYYESLRSGLATQLLSHVLVQPTEEADYYRTRNFMDGGNGIFNYSYSALGKFNGIAPYENSNHIFLGWWTFLDSNEIRDMYHDIASSFPLNSNTIDVYTRANTSRDRHPLTTVPDTFRNGFFQLISVLAAEIDSA